MDTCLVIVNSLLGFSVLGVTRLPRLRYADGVQAVIIVATTFTTPRVVDF